MYFIVRPPADEGAVGLERRAIRNAVLDLAWPRIIAEELGDVSGHEQRESSGGVEYCAHTAVVGDGAGVVGANACAIDTHILGGHELERRELLDGVDHRAHPAVVLDRGPGRVAAGSGRQAGH